MTAPARECQPSSDGCLSAEDREALDQVYIAHIKKLMAAQAARIEVLEAALRNIIKANQVDRFTTIECDPAGNTMRVDEVDGPFAVIARAALNPTEPQ